MKQTVFFLCFLCASFLCCAGHAERCEIGAGTLQTVLLHRYSDGSERDCGKDKLWDANLNDPSNREACLTDTTGLFRLCQPRPQRILTVEGSRTARLLPRWFIFNILSFHSVFPYREDGSRSVTAPFRPQVPGEYYVFALNRLLC